MTKENVQVESKRVAPRKTPIVASRMGLKVLPTFEKPKSSEKYWFDILYAVTFAKEISTTNIDTTVSSASDTTTYAKAYNQLFKKTFSWLNMTLNRWTGSCTYPFFPAGSDIIVR